MSDTTTPSAAEVMGWEPAFSIAFGATWGLPDGSSRDQPPTPDDMLVWLVERVDGGGWNPPGSLAITVTPGYLQVQWYHGDKIEMVSAPTLHAALEQAVIAVGRAE